MDLGLTDQVFVVTGGSRGLGFATARVLVDEGARVVITGRDQRRTHKAASALGGPDRAIGVLAEAADPEAASRLVGAALARFDRLDGAFLSVGGPPPGTVLSITDDLWRDSFESVFLGAVRTARAVVAELPAVGGALLFVLSTSVRSPIPGLAISNGLRPGLAMAAKTLADELGPRGIRVNGILPGRILTERIEQLDSGSSAADRRRVSESIPLRRDGDPAEFGRVAAFLLSPAASYVSGTMVTVDGGMTRTY